MVSTVLKTLYSSGSKKSTYSMNLHSDEKKQAIKKQVNYNILRNGKCCGKNKAEKGIYRFLVLEE